MTDAEYWQDRWKRNDIGFHEGQPNPFLAAYFAELALEPGSRVFVPLCGKSRDLAWLLAQGCRVAGAELSQIAVEQLFQELGVEPVLSTAGKTDRYSAPNIDLFNGDLFDVDAAALGPVDAIYDRAALVALPRPVRDRYSAHLMEISRRAPQWLICFEYDQTQVAGPPFSISAAEVAEHYSEAYHLRRLASADVPGGLKGKCAARETAWLLQPKQAVL